MQGPGDYDTPQNTKFPEGGLMVKKVGRTTGLTKGQIVGPLITPLGIPYESARFRSMVYFDNVWVVRTLTGTAFSLAGDSGSLVVTEDGNFAVGLIFAGAPTGEVSYIIPIDSVLAGVGASLVSGHGT